MDTEEFKTWRMSMESPSVLWCTYRRNPCLLFPDRALSLDTRLGSVHSLDIFKPRFTPRTGNANLELRPWYPRFWKICYDVCSTLLLFYIQTLT